MQPTPSPLGGPLAGSFTQSFTGGGTANHGRRSSSVHPHELRVLPKRTASSHSCRRAASGAHAPLLTFKSAFNKGEGGFLVGDLYPFCFNISDSKLVAVANPNAKNLIGTDGRTVKDSTGKLFGVEQLAAAQKTEGEITVTDYMFPKPGADKTPVTKESFTTKVGDLVCGVGYYK